MDYVTAAYILQQLLNRDADCRCGNFTLEDGDKRAITKAIGALTSPSKGGSSTSEAKQTASRLNGAKGGRPRTKR